MRAFYLILWFQTAFVADNRFCIKKISLTSNKEKKHYYKLLVNWINWIAQKKKSVGCDKRGFELSGINKLSRSHHIWYVQGSCLKNAKHSTNIDILSTNKMYYLSVETFLII